MKRMPNISLTEKELNKIIEFGSFNREGGESIICLGDRPNTLYKIFYDIFKQEIIEMPPNKHKKVIKLYEEDLDYSVRPLSTISVDGKLFGYELTYDRKDKTPPWSYLKREQLLHILRESKKALEHFADHDITYGDVKGNNILVNYRTGAVKFCDMDNVRIRDLPIDLYGRPLKSYVRITGQVDYKADAYMHNLLVLQQLGFPSTYAQLEGVAMALESNLPRAGFEKQGLEILRSMANPKEFTGEYVVQYIKK